MIRITDEAVVFSMLEKFGAAEFDYSVHQARFMRSASEFIFFLFCSKGASKGAQVFVFGNPPAAGDIEQNLLRELLQFGNDEYAESARDLAIDAVREYLETKDAREYFFDAH